ncbi:MAG TPA: biopolymer transporter ExbD [Spirochaetales bacterium]|nr:biopolymer transporter ExbD [Spirochaetales bacterium]HPD80674.1 biopolymer transporter ExbD [Spirochaetales bacterium]HRV27359.1 biopolymer transporter ExbD [Spirochaetia bacterium]
MIIERRLKPNVNVDLTPLIDVIFQLVIFFMITTTFKTNPAIALDLPEAGTSEPVILNQLTITALSKDEVYINEIRTTVDGAAKVIKNEIEAKKLDVKQVNLLAEKNVSYDVIISLLDACRTNNISNIALNTTLPKGKK